MAYTNVHFLRRVEAVQKLAREHYEPGRHDRSWRWVWRYRVAPVYNIGFSTFQRYMRIDVEAERQKLDYSNNDHTAE